MNRYTNSSFRTTRDRHSLRGWIFGSFVLGEREIAETTSGAAPFATCGKDEDLALFHHVS